MNTSAKEQEKFHNPEECQLIWEKVLKILSNKQSETWIERWFGNSRLAEVSQSKVLILLKDYGTWRSFDDYEEDATEAALKEVLGYKPKHIWYGIR